MYPMFWTWWAPQINWPWSGSVAQCIDLFNSIAPTAGSGRIEKKAFEVASYGRQLGLIAEVLVDLAENHQRQLSGQGQRSFERLKEIKKDIETIKKQETGQFVASVKDFLSSLQEKPDPSEFNDVIDALRPFFPP